MALRGTIRSWGHGFLRPMMKLWEEGFRKYHPAVLFDDKLVTSAAAIASLYTQRADLGRAGPRDHPARGGGL